ncbi:hypothetical protein EDD25_3508 [Cryobacterium psychrophilum]|nr:hypothetical protein EDD25_3508 [Cryobacterium psychrophilum]
MIPYDGRLQKRFITAIIDRHLKQRMLEIICINGQPPVSCIPQDLVTQYRALAGTRRPSKNDRTTLEPNPRTTLHNVSNEPIMKLRPTTPHNGATANITEPFRIAHRGMRAIRRERLTRLGQRTHTRAMGVNRAPSDSHY